MGLNPPISCGLKFTLDPFKMCRNEYLLQRYHVYRCFDVGPLQIIYWKLVIHFLLSMDILSGI